MVLMQFFACLNLLLAGRYMHMQLGHVVRKPINLIQG